MRPVAAAVAAAAWPRALATAATPQPRRAWAQFSEVRERLNGRAAEARRHPRATSGGSGGSLLAHFPALPAAAPPAPGLPAARQGPRGVAAAAAAAASHAAQDAFSPRDEEMQLLMEEQTLHDAIFPHRSDVDEAVYQKALARASPQSTDEWERHLAACRFMNDPYTLVKRFHGGLMGGLRPSRAVLRLVMDACLHLNQREMTIEVLQMHRKFGLVPDAMSYNVLLLWACRYRDVAFGQSLYERMLSEGVSPDADTFNMLLLQASVAGDTSVTGRYFYDAVRAGIKPDTFRYTRLIDVYARARDSHRAMRTFDAMLLDKVQPRSHTIVCLLYSCIDSRWPNKILDIYRSLPRLGIPVTNAVFAALTAVSARAVKQLPMAEYFFNEYRARLSEHPQPLSVQVYSAMISAYGRHGRVADAERLFFELERSQPDAPLLRAVTALVVAYGHNAMPHKARELFESMASKHRLVYQSSTHGALVDALARCGECAEAAHALERMRRAGFSPTPAHYGSILHGLLKHNQLEQALVMFERMKSLRVLSVVAFGMMIEAYSQRRDFAKCEQLYAEIGRFGFTATADVHRFMMRAAVRAHELDRALFYYDRLTEHGPREAEQALPLLLEANLQARRHDAALEIFWRIRALVPAATSVSLTTLLNFYRKEKMTTRLRDLWSSRQAHGRLTAGPYNVMLAHYASVPDVNAVDALQREMKAQGIRQDDYTIAALLTCYARARLLDRVRDLEEQVMNRGPAFTVPLINQFIRVYFDADEFTDALRLFLDMPRLRLRPDSFTFHTMIKHLARRRMSSALGAVLESLRAQEAPVGEQVAQVLVDAYGQLGDLAQMDRVAAMLADELRTPLTSGCYERIFAACGRARDLARLQRYQGEFAAARPPLTPTGGLCAALVTGLSRCGRYDDAVRAFDNFARQGLPPDARALRALIQTHLAHGRLTLAQHALADLRALFPRHVIAAECAEMVARRLRTTSDQKAQLNEVEVLRRAGVDADESFIGDAELASQHEDLALSIFAETPDVRSFQALR